MFNTLGAGWELCAQLHAVREGEQEGLRRLGSTGTVLLLAILYIQRFEDAYRQYNYSMCIITIEATRFASVLWTDLYRISYRFCLELNYRSLTKITLNDCFTG